MDTEKNGNCGESRKAEAHGGEKISLVIVRQSYTYLEPFVRSMFEGADDIRIIVDRRFHERRKVSIPGLPNRRRTLSERRFPAPMLDIMIAVDS